MLWLLNGRRPRRLLQKSVQHRDPSLGGGAFQPSITEDEPQKALSSGRGKRSIRNGPCESGETKTDCSFWILGVSQKYAVVLMQDFLCKSIAFGFK